MAITLRVLNEATNGSGSVVFDFVYDILASEDGYPISNENEFYFKVSTTTKQVGTGANIPIKIIKKLDDLSLNGAKQSRSDTASAYSSVTDMVEDYLYDTIHGHTDGQYSSGVSAQGAMDI